MAGIEDAFEKFVTRVSGKEEPQSEYGEPQTGEKRIPLMQGIKRGYDFENTMPNYYNQRYDYENEMPMYQDDRYNIPQQELMGGGVASMFRERPGYQMGGVTPQLNPFASREETLEEAIARGEIFYNPITGIEINPLTGMDVPGGRILQSIINSQQQYMQQPQVQIPLTQSPQLSYNEMQKANYARRIGELEDKFARQGTSSTKYIQDMTNLLAQMKTSGGIDPLGAMQSKYYTGPSSGSVSEGRGIDANFVINRAQQAERDAAARVTPTRMAEGGLTTTVPPAKGPDSQGVESLFRRRYS
jgi:hypothetical protein